MHDLGTDQIWDSAKWLVESFNQIIYISRKNIWSKTKQRITQPKEITDYPALDLIWCQSPGPTFTNMY